MSKYAEPLILARLLKLLGILSLAGAAALCFFAWFSGDDICYRNELARYGVFEKAWLQYLHWDGRSLGIASLIQLACLKYFSAPVTCLVWTLSFIAIAMLVLKIVEQDKPMGNKMNPTVISVALLSSVMWLGMWKLVPDILYWPTGGWYCVMCLVGLFWIDLFMNDLRIKKFSSGRNIMILLVSAICSVNSHNLVLSLFMLVLIELIFIITSSRDKKAISYCLFALAGIIAGASFVLAAPGNMERLKAISWQGFSISFFYHCTLVLSRYIYWLAALFTLLILFAWLNDKKIIPTAKAFTSLINYIKTGIKTPHSFSLVLHDHKYLIAAFSTILVFSATSFFAVPRTAIFFAVFLIIFALQKSNISFEKVQSTKFLRGGILFHMVFLGILFFEVWKVNMLHQTLGKRERTYDINHGKDVVVDAIAEASVPFAFIFVDISPDSTNWVNRCVATNYGLKTVRTEAH